MLIKNLTLAFLFSSVFLFAQKELKFQSKSDYLSFMAAKFDIEKSDLYYFNSVSDSAYIGRVSPVIFMKGTMMVTEEEIREKEGNVCNPEKFLKLLTLERISSHLTENKNLATSFFRNIETDAIHDTANQLTAIFVFSYQFGKRGLTYIKHKEYLDKLNIKSIILTADDAEINGISNKRSTKTKMTN